MLEVFYLDYMERRNRKQKKKHSHEGKNINNHFLCSLNSCNICIMKKRRKWMIDCRQVFNVKLYYVKYGLVQLGGTWWLVTYTKIIGLKTTLFILN
jgi:hypothetical protein